MPAPKIAIDRLRQSTPLITLVLLMAIVGALQPSFLTAEALLQLAGDTATLFVLACGSSFVIMLGGIDHVKLKIPSFIATLAVGGVLAGAALVISHEHSITLDEHQREYLTWITGTSFGIPHEIFIGLV